MESYGENQERFPKTYSKVAVNILKLEGSIQGKVIHIAICPTKKENLISDGLKKQLLIPQSSIVEKIYKYDAKQYEVTNLQLRINKYKFTCQFNVLNIYLNEVDIILSSPLMETLGSVILNMRKKCLTFSYKKKKITLHDVSMKLDS